MPLPTQNRLENHCADESAGVETAVERIAAEAAAHLVI
jgi:hypothetical protein